MKTTEYGKQNPEVILLLHGGGLSWWNFRAEAELLGDRYHVVLPVLDGHADSDRRFTSIEENADRIISLIDGVYGGTVLLIGGLSLGAQVAAEILSKRAEICRFAILESASVIPSRVTHALIGAATASSYGMIRKNWFAKTQFRSLHMREDLFEDYYQKTKKIRKDDMIAFLKANTAYALKPELRKCRARIRIVVGEKEQRSMLRSAQLLHETLPESIPERKAGLYHGEYSINHPDQYVTDLLKMLGEKPVDPVRNQF